MSVYGRGLKITRTKAVLPGRQAAESSVMWGGCRTTFLAVLIAVNRSAKSAPPRPPQRRSSRDRPQARYPKKGFTQNPNRACFELGKNITTCEQVVSVILSV